MRLIFTFRPPLEDKAASFRKLAETGIYEGIGRIAKDAGSVMLAALRAAAPVSSGGREGRAPGTFRDSLAIRQYGGRGQITLAFVAEQPLAKFIIEGTAPHRIEPVTAKALRFFNSSGDVVFAKSVQHPGTKPNDFVGEAVQGTWSELIDILGRTGREVLMEVAN